MATYSALVAQLSRLINSEFTEKKPLLEWVILTVALGRPAEFVLVIFAALRRDYSRFSLGQTA
jgi:hypothetical protein